mmetsp:Transcript_2132/g.3920  ORF Transcript_2132/g.3920 Transcript_2132/m.3920 type:complete len:385 (+) Transcript_2132:99-1253(+)
MLRSTCFLAAAAIVGSLLFFTWPNNDDPSSIHPHRLLSVVEFIDPKSTTPRETPHKLRFARVPTQIDSNAMESYMQNRANCQVVYIMGVEGASHHGFFPVLEALAKHQVDPVTQLEFDVDIDPRPLKSAMFGWHSQFKRGWGFSGKQSPPIDHPDLVRGMIESSCPLDGKKHVMLDWQSFPSGQEDDPRSYRVHRQHKWLSMTPEEIAADNEALSHPTDMAAFVEAYSPYAEIRFVVLSRPFLETIASHPEWDESPLVHSNVIRGFLLILRNFLNVHNVDRMDGRRSWAMVCTERLMAKFYKQEEDVTAARANIISYLATFLGWPVGECPHCFDNWHDSKKDPLKVLGKVGPEALDTLFEHKWTLEEAWPPRGEEGVEEQQCRL